MHIERKAGEKMEIDWSGDQVNIIDPETGEVTKTSLLVVTIGRSGYPYVEAFLNRDLPSFITGVVNALTYFGGVPPIFVPDNDKSAVIKANKYEPLINKTFQELADYYEAAVIPARVRSPKDKPTVEKTVHDLAEREILGKARNVKFYSIKELNIYIKKALKTFSSKSFQKKDGSRLSVFLEEDFPKLKPLPQSPFELTTYKVATVNIDYHISFEYNHYSVPFQYVKQKVELRIKRHTIEIIHNNERIAIHERIHGKKNKYSTQPNHMPNKHEYYAGMNREYFESWALKISPHVLSVVEGIFDDRLVEQHGYRACMGLQSLYRKNPQAFIQACKLACDYNATSYQHVNQFMQKIIKDKEQATFEEETFIKHYNIRGITYYQTTLASINEGVQS
jgi:transposase